MRLAQTAALLPLLLVSTLAQARDVVLVVDIAQRPFQRTLPEMQATVRGLVGRLATRAQPGDRIALVGFAGEAVVLSDFEDVATASPSALGDLVLPCTVDEDAWYAYYRYYDWVTLGDNEVGGNGLNYRFVEDQGVGGPGLNVSSNSPEGQYLAAELDPTLLSTPLTPLEQCQLWDVSLSLFQESDPRRESQLVDPPSHGLQCHEGNYYDGRADRFHAVPRWDALGLDCVNQGWDTGPIPGTNWAKFGGPVGLLQPDRSYAVAGSNPSRGLALASELLDDLGVDGDIVLVSNQPRPCGWNRTLTALADCDDLRRQEALDTARAVRQAGHQVVVLGVAADGSTADRAFATYATSRATYRRHDTIADLAAAHGAP
jgi:hypothetical protein